MAQAKGTNPTVEKRTRMRIQAPRVRAELAGSNYSSFVGAMKMVLPAVGLALVIMVIVWPEFRKHEHEIVVGVANITQDDVEKQRLTNPRYQGTDKQGEPYTVTAQSSTKKNPNSDVWDLEQPQADITLSRGAWVTLRSDFGAYREADQQLDLIGNVNLYRDDGYAFRTLSAHIDFVKNTAEGDDPVEGQGPSGEVTAEGFRIYDKGDRVIFTGKAHLNLRPHAGDTNPLGG
ncbi:MAG TPA: LPS export ABC transporter periplasmic protein LptC [Alphaproteobacteria bacterium]|nr:LPS export ABC transporter periplasmic protein LptC [Alphaproteobacteria bacterium]